MEYKHWIVIGTEMLFLGIGTWFDVKEQKLPVPFLNIFIVLDVSIFSSGQDLKSSSASILNMRSAPSVIVVTKE